MSPRCCLKVDIKKAYDSVEWPFLSSMLEELGFPSNFNGWIMACVQSSRLLRSVMLLSSPEKSNIYLAGVTQEEATNLVEANNMNFGTLLFRYLGIPLSAKKVTYSQCKPLIERITSRAQGWIVKLLSYVGRLQLVRSILSSMQNYWGHIFPLPKKMIKVVEAICRRLLWTCNTIDSKKAPIACSKFYEPKSCGGWNLINMALWNKVAMLKLLWAIAFKTDKMWVKWVHAYYIKRLTYSTVNVTAKSSWLLRNH
ncbi:uncharacterized protein LOC104882983 [Beta vulgaris subsp. vulgaris]|uniref:uncharacterized protein LOC104882983 n=1 Tax=Beta vulgaris subsp. vulgaris TaxID=3555 RepID=UPI000540090B|nr:uncharacterized protein LOC104882983 [Beta vulgaris subsp. vulgaris]